MTKPIPQQVQEVVEEFKKLSVTNLREKGYPALADIIGDEVEIGAVQLSKATNWLTTTLTTLLEEQEKAVREEERERITEYFLERLDVTEFRRLLNKAITPPNN